MKTIVHVVLVASALCASAALAVGVAWPSDFDEKLAGHIAAEKSTNTTSSACALSIDTCYRTCDSLGFSVMRMPPVKPGMCIIIL